MPANDPSTQAGMHAETLPDGSQHSGQYRRPRPTPGRLVVPGSAGRVMLGAGTSPLSVSDGYGDDVFDLNSIDLEEIATALADQSAYDHRWLIDPNSGAVVFWTSDTGIDGRTPVDLDELDLIAIDPLPSHVWYEDMADFAERLSNERAGQRLSRAIAGRGAFRRFKDELHQEYADLVPTWNAFRDVRALRRAVEWLADNALIADDAAAHYLDRHTDPEVP